MRFAAAYGQWVQAQQRGDVILIGRDARPSGPMLLQLVSATLVAQGFTVLDAGLATTPSVEMGVVHRQAAGGIILTASHNPVEWNALKLLNYRGEFLSPGDAQAVLENYERQDYRFRPVRELGQHLGDERLLEHHIEHILDLDLVDTQAIGQANLRIVVDAVNSVGGLAVPELLRKLGVKDIVELYCHPNGDFPHNPEPLAEHLGDVCQRVRDTKADLGLVVDPDVDRLAIIDEHGNLIGEEYSLVAIADYVLRHTPGPVVNNLSSSRALIDVAAKYGQACYSAAVGEVHVVEQMKRVNAVIGGEGNGGIIYPALHYGRDALVGIALFLSHLAQQKQTVSELRSQLPSYYMSKQKANLSASQPVDQILKDLVSRETEGKINTTDGVKIDLADRWVHLRKSNTEPIVRIYAEAPDPQAAIELANSYKAKLEA